MENLYDCIACPEDCGDFSLPAVDFADCVDSHEDEESEITEVFMTVPVDDGSGNTTAKNGPTTWTSAAAWAAAIDNTTTDKVRHLIVIGDKGAATQDSRVISRGRTKYGIKTFTVNIDIDDVSLLNYDFVRALECGVDVIFWYQSKGGYLYGGAEGIKATAQGDWILDRGAGSYARGTIVFTWTARCNPERIVSPIAIAA